MKIVNVNASKKYSVTVTRGKDVFLTAALPSIKGGNVAIVTDGNVDALYSDYFSGLLTDKKVVKYVIKSGENSKNFAEYGKILEFLIENGFQRDDTVITFGGGVVGDLGGFVAATYMRGINLISVPTTLLAAVDSSVGGKTAVNLTKGKNACGAFYQPSAVYVDVELLKTLPSREILSGFGEILKYSYLIKSGEEFSFKNLTKVKNAFDDRGEVFDERAGGIIDLIARAISFKARVVEKDERESGLRKILNFGHTVGHAYEKLSDFTLSHGEAVAYGVYYALKASEIYFGLSANISQNYLDRAKLLGFNFGLKYAANDLSEVIAADKKRFCGGIDVVLLDSELSVKPVRLNFDEFCEILKKI